MSDAKLLQRILETCQRTEAKVDELVKALNEEDEPQPRRTLEGEDAGQERDQSRSLDEP
jgi:hypothetical protein